MDDHLIKRAAEDILHSKKTIAFTGAGISVESGIPDFRGAQGLWQKYDPEEYADIQAFYSNPDKVWRMLKDMFELIMAAEPNPAHIGLAELERMGLLSSVITQNVDGLHHAAGNRNVIEFHGSHRTLSCLKCSTKVDAARDPAPYSYSTRGCVSGGQSSLFCGQLLHPVLPVADWQACHPFLRERALPRGRRP